MIPTIALRELRTLFLAPLAWVILGVMMTIFAIFFLSDMLSFLQQPRPEGLTRFVVTPLFGLAAWLLAFIIPLLTMRLVSEERRNQTLTLLFSAPISMTEIVLGKFLGIVLYLLILIGLMVLLPLSLLLGGNIDFGILASSVIGLVLLLSAITAIGLFMSTLTQSPALAAIMAFGAVFLLLILEAIINWLASPIAAYLSIFRHYLPFINGVVDTADVFYYLSLITAFLIFSVRRLEAERVGA